MLCVRLSLRADSNQDVISGKVKRYASMADAFKRVPAEQGMAAFWRGNLVNCLRYAPQQGSALAFNDYLGKVFPKYDSKTDFYKAFGINVRKICHFFCQR